MKEKIFVVGLPRTATTSVCIAALELGLKTAHTAYTNQCFEEAEFIADTPCFAYYQQLSQYYPNSRFVLLERNIEPWLMSIERLLARMAPKLFAQSGGFAPLLKSSYQKVFPGINANLVNDHGFLAECYAAHHSQVTQFFAHQSQRLLTIDVSAANSYEQFCSFLDKPVGQGFAHVNKQNKVMAWKHFSHPLKVASTRQGKVDPVLHVLGSGADGAA